MINSDMLNYYNNEFVKCSNEIHRLLSEINLKFNIRNEVTLLSDSLKYIIELINLNKFEDDDYGVIVDFSVKNFIQHTSIQVDISKAIGEIYLEKGFVTTNSENNEVELNYKKDFSSFLDKLPKIILNIYVNDYNS